MLSVTQSAALLGVSGARVRALIKEGMLPATKIGRAWLIEEKDVLQRALAHPKAGRPASKALDNISESSEEPNLAEAFGSEAEALGTEGHKLYLACKEYFRFRPSGEMISQAASAEEASFYMAVADFFLQQRQAQLVAKGIY